MSFKKFFNEEEIIDDRDSEDYQKILDADLINAAHGSYNMHDPIKELKDQYVEEISDYLFRLMDRLREKFFKIVNSGFVVKILRAYNFEGKIKTLTEILRLFFIDSRFAKYLMKKFSGIEKIRSRYEKDDAFLREKIKTIDFDIGFI
jgi:hypothetical protein